MRLFLCLMLPVFFLSGCLTTNESEKSAESAPILNLPDWRFLAKIKHTFAGESDYVPKNVYVFPALRLDQNGQPIDALMHRVDENGELHWFSPAPRGSEIQSVIQGKLTQKGHHIVSFQELMNSPKPFSVLVINPYFTEARKSKANLETGIPEGWSTFTRLTGSTFPADLNPSGKRDIVQQEIVSLFTKESTEPDVIKRSFIYSASKLGQNKEWTESISLLK